MLREVTVLIVPGLRDHVPQHWQTLPASRLPDPLSSCERATAFPRSRGSKLIDLGEVGHLNPAFGFGDWPQADALISELDAAGSQSGMQDCVTA
jgi:uncharacterized protein